MRSNSHTDVIRRIQAAGYLTEIHATSLPNLPKLNVDGNPINSIAFAWGCGTGFVFEISIRSDRQTRIVEFDDLEVDGHRLDVDWWTNDRRHPYRFAGRRGPEYPWDSVLNHRVHDRGIVEPGNPMEGFLLGRCMSPLPTNCRRSDVPTKLWIVDGFETVHVADLVLWFDDTVNIEFARRRSTLFDGGVRGSDDLSCEDNVSIENPSAPDADGTDIPSTKGKRVK